MMQSTGAPNPRDKIVETSLSTRWRDRVAVGAQGSYRRRSSGSTNRSGPRPHSTVAGSNRRPVPHRRLPARVALAEVAQPATRLREARAGATGGCGPSPAEAIERAFDIFDDQIVHGPEYDRDAPAGPIFAQGRRSRDRGHQLLKAKASGSWRSEGSSSAPLSSIDRL